MSAIDYHFHIHYIMHTMPILQYQPWTLVLLNLPVLGLQACIVSIPKVAVPPGVQAPSDQAVYSLSSIR
jgi:hypothetical protein